LSMRSDAGVGPKGGGDKDEGTSGNWVAVGELVPAEGTVDEDEGSGERRGCASCASARARSTRVIEFLSKTRLRSVSRSRGRSDGDVAVWSLRRERFESQAVVSMLWNMDGVGWCSSSKWSGKVCGAVTELPSVVVSVEVVEDVLNDERVWWTVAVDDEEEGQGAE
jgi:hypothetical protein